MLQGDNARPHTDSSTKRVIADLGWSVLPHSPYSPDLVPSVYFLFGTLKWLLQGRSFKSRSAIGRAVQNWVAGINADNLSSAIVQLQMS